MTAPLSIPAMVAEALPCSFADGCPDGHRWRADAGECVAEYRPAVAALIRRVVAECAKEMADTTIHFDGCDPVLVGGPLAAAILARFGMEGK